MKNNRLHIEEFISFSQNSILLDVRSPSEFKHAHIPGAVNLPLFSDDERKIVGTAYKQISREDAIKAGLDFFGPKMRKMVEEVENMVKQKYSSTSATKPTVFIYCWRGGMRSAAVGWLLELYGFKVYLLSAGYKSFRNYVLNTFTKDFSFKVVGGFTGSGKTEVIKELVKSGKTVIDLEEIARHKGSAFGNLNRNPQPTQEMFENLLAWQLLPLMQGVTDIWIEDESQRIGNLNIPMDLWNQMRKAPIFFLDIRFEKRLEHIIEEYGKQDAESILNSIQRISKRLGGVDTKKACEYLKAGDLNECFGILLKYYDKYYLRGLHNRENLTTLLHTIPCDNIGPENFKFLQSNHSVL